MNERQRNPSCFPISSLRTEPCSQKLRSRFNLTTATCTTPFSLLRHWSANGAQTRNEKKVEPSSSLLGKNRKAVALEMGPRLFALRLDAVYFTQIRRHRCSATFRPAAIGVMMCPTILFRCVSRTCQQFRESPIIIAMCFMLVPSFSIESRSKSLVTDSEFSTYVLFHVLDLSA